MSPDKMRKIDARVGSVLCFLLTLVLRLGRLFRSNSSKALPGPERILFISLAEIGALVVTHPAVQRARAKYPDAEFYYMTFPAGELMLDMMGFDADHRFILRPDSLSSLAKSSWQVLKRCRELGIDSAVNFECYARFSTLMATLSGAERRVGFYRFNEEGHYLGDLITHPVVYNPHVHAAQTYVTLVEALADDTPGKEPKAKTLVSYDDLDRLQVNPAASDLASVQHKLRTALPDLADDARLIVLNANASDLIIVRRWDPENFVALAHKFLVDPKVVIVLTGAPNEAPAAAKMVAAINHDRVINMAGQTTMKELLALYSLCSLMVTNDSGPVHFASTTLMPTVALFGPETPKIFGPLGDRQRAIHLGLACSPCVNVYNQKKTPCHDNACMQGITVDRVYQESLDLMVEVEQKDPVV